MTFLTPAARLHGVAGDVARATAGEDRVLLRLCWPIVPERATLMVGGDGRPEMIERLLDKAEREFAASNRRLSPAIYTADDAGKIVPYARPAGDPLAMKVTIAHEKLAIYEYGQQREALDKLYEKNGPDV